MLKLSLHIYFLLTHLTRHRFQLASNLEFRLQVLDPCRYLPSVVIFCRVFVRLNLFGLHWFTFSSISSFRKILLLSLWHFLMFLYFIWFSGGSFPCEFSSSTIIVFFHYFLRYKVYFYPLPGFPRRAGFDTSVIIILDSTYVEALLFLSPL